MRILTEMIGGVVLLLIVAYGINAIIHFFSQRERPNERVRHSGPPDAAAGPDESR